ncbi:MAG: hypothetical protein ABGX24_01800 [Aquificota bacterium]|jgi:hypothetical protein
MAKIIKFPGASKDDKDPNKDKKVKIVKVEGQEEPQPEEGVLKLAEIKIKKPEEPPLTEVLPIKNARPLTEEEFNQLLEPFKEGLKKLYPSQVEDVYGVFGVGEKNGNKVFMVGAVIWKHYGVPQPYTSTFVALFENNQLQKISFLEAKRNYWDWRTLIKMHKHEFHTEELFNYFQQLKEQIIAQSQGNQNNPSEGDKK